MTTNLHADRFVLSLDEIDPDDVATVGNKAAHLGRLTRIEGVRVPPGFCVTTDAFAATIAANEHLAALLAHLAELDPDDHTPIDAISAEVRHALEQAAIPTAVTAGITAALDGLGAGTAVAVRSSATAEDLPGASFAGLYDSFLDVVGADAVLQMIRRCWASLYSPRAVAYRLRHGIDHRTVQMAVVVQEMVAADASGVLFTADPVTSNRKVVAIEAVRGRGDALLTGTANADSYRVRDGVTVERMIQAEPVLTDANVLRLAQLGRHLEAHLGGPQDVEWCLGDDVHVVQSRPITTLFPIPDVGDDERHVFVSVGHQQMMTEAMKPLGLSVFQLTALRPMYAAGGRLFVDVTAALAAPAGRAALLDMFGRFDPLLRDAVATVLDDTTPPPAASDAAGPARLVPDLPPADPAIVDELIERTEASLRALRERIDGASGDDLLQVIADDIDELKRLLLDRQSVQAVMAGMDASWWLNERLAAWLGEHNPADALTRSAPGNVTSEMGLALLDVADAIRPHPEVVAFLERVDHADFLDDLTALPGGTEARAAFDDYLDRYGMRGAAEIDITRPRWREDPRPLLPAILANVRNREPGARQRLVEAGLAEAAAKERDVLARVRALPGGEQKAAEVKQMIDRLRTFIGYREHPKYGIASRYFLYRQVLLAEAERLVAAGVLSDGSDIAYLTFDELREVVRTHHVDHDLLRRRQEEHERFRTLVPPRVITSDGEAVLGSHRNRDVPPGALAGVAVSAGTVEGRARVVLDMGAAELEPGDILVTVATDPSWSPLFVAAAGLVTEVGGLMTHGAVIAREYGLPTVVGVPDATRLIRDGQRIRVDGARGYVELVTTSAPAA